MVWKMQRGWELVTGEGRQRTERNRDANWRRPELGRRD